MFGILTHELKIVQKIYGQLNVPIFKTFFLIQAIKPFKKIYDFKTFNSEKFYVFVPILIV